MHVLYRYKYCDAHFFIMTTQCLCCCYGPPCGGRHFDLAPLGCSAPSGCRLVYCTVYRSHGWRHFVMVCIVGAAILIYATRHLFYHSHGGRHFDLVNTPKHPQARVYPIIL